MAREDIIMLSRKEISRVKIIHAVLDKQMTQVEAGEFLELSDRQVRRITGRGMRKSRLYLIATSAIMLVDTAAIFM